MVGPIPKQRHGDVLQAERRQPHRLTGGIDLTKIRLGQSFLRPHLGKQTTGAAGVRRLAEHRQRDQQHTNRDQHHQRDRPQAKPPAFSVWSHRARCTSRFTAHDEATSRDLRKNAPSTNITRT